MAVLVEFRNRSLRACWLGNLTEAWAVAEEEPMHLVHRRKFLHLIASATALPPVSRVGWAQAYPSRPVHLINGFPAGTTADAFARLAAQWLGDRLGQPCIVDNRPGAGTSIAAEAVARAAPDGHTLLWMTAANASNATYYDNLKFDLARDIAPIATVVSTSFVLVINRASPARTLLELIAYAKANPGKLNIGVGGNGTLLHLSTELFKMMAGVNLTNVLYRGDGPALTDLLGGQVDVAFAGSSAIEQVKSGNLRALGVSSQGRWKQLPDVPAIGEAVPGYEASGWQGIGAPKNTPAEIVTKLSNEINAGLADPMLREHIAQLGGVVTPLSPADFSGLIATDTQKWAKVIRAANIKLE
jgi:tripartite-type tricarboxylate transporter receptor subunit TctC